MMFMLQKPPVLSALERRLVAGVVVGLVVGVGVFGLASPAFAESSWWGLTAGARPTFLHAGAGKPAIPGEDEVQRITVNATSGTFVLADMTQLEVEKEELFCEGHTPESKFAILGVNAMAAEVQSGLEAVCGYEGGNVQVTGEGAGETSPFVVRFVGALASRPVRLIYTEFPGFEGAATVSEITKGVAVTPAVPDGELVVTAENLGDANAEGTSEVSDLVPAGLEAIGVSGWKANGASFNLPIQLPCSLSSPPGQRQRASCRWEGQVPSYETIEERIAVNVKPGASSGELNEVSASGAGSRPAKLSRRITIAEGSTPFGVEDYELRHEEDGGVPAVQAGVHPFQQTTTIVLNQGRDPSPISIKQEAQPAGSPKDTELVWPAGLVGNPSAVAKCSIAQFLSKVGAEENECPSQSVVGVAVVSANEPSNVGTGLFTLPLFNLQPAPGEPARFGFYVLIGHSPVVIDTKVRSGGDYGVTVQVKNITQTAGFLSAKVTVWGTPGDPRHDSARNWGCLYEARGAIFEHEPCVPLGERYPKPFLVLPTSCPKTPLQSMILADPWSEPGAFRSLPAEPIPALVGCDRLPFEAEIKTTPDGQEASTPTGLNVDVHVPQDVNENGAGLSSSNLKDISITFPQGVTLNPAAADGLLACSEGLVGFRGFEGLEPGSSTATFTPEIEVPFCPDASKVGTATIRTPLLPNPLVGALYLAAPAPNGEEGQNPFGTLLAAYIVARDPVSGVVVKLPGRITLDQGTGQLTATFEHNPQVAFEDAEVHLFGGDRAPLSTPSRCGTYTTVATFTPWSGAPAVTSSSSFQIVSGPDGGPCPGGALPFSPSFAGGTTNISAGAFSDLTSTFGRQDGQQNINRVQLHFPAGLSGILSGIPLCGEAQANAGSCSEGSRIGETIVSVGLGGDPFTVTGGKVYLTGPYKGAPFGLSIVNPAVAGPFNLGKVIVRAKIEVDPHTAALTVTTNNESEGFAIPHILDGIPLQIKHINVTIDRPGFTFNPTNCTPASITGSIGSLEGASAAISEHLQVTNCASLKFAPQFAVSTSGKTSKANGASLTAKVSYPQAPQGTYANITRVKVDLPKQLPSRLTTLQKACTNAQFEANPAACPAPSKIGFAKVTTPLLPVPLEGPAIFVSHGGEAFPSLTMVLQGYGVTVDLVGTTFISKAGVTSTTFKTVPDTPFSTFTLTLPQGKYSALAANGNLCTSKLVMPTEFLAQNGLKINESTKISVTGCAKKKTLTRAQKLTAALKVCERKAKRRRAGCERAAHSKYGPSEKQRKK